MSAKRVITFIVPTIVTYLKKRKHTMDDDYLEIQAKQMAQAEYIQHVSICTKKMEEAKVPVQDEYTQGISDGLDWAIRILEKDKSAY